VSAAPARKLATVSLVVRDYDEAIAFYVGVLGFSLIEDTDLGEGKRWVIVSPGGEARLLLARAATPEQSARVGDQTGGRVFLFLETSDFDADFARLTAAGVRFVRAPSVQPYGKVAVFADLYGTLWDLIGPNSGRA